MAQSSQESVSFSVHFVVIEIIITGIEVGQSIGCSRMVTSMHPVSCCQVQHSSNAPTCRLCASPNLIALLPVVEI
jgi:hypothetical protein